MSREHLRVAVIEAAIKETEAEAEEDRLGQRTVKQNPVGDYRRAADELNMRRMARADAVRMLLAAE